MGASPQGGFYSTPAFEIFRRGLHTQTIKRFRGINAFHTRTRLGPEWALDCLNVIVPGNGGLSKFRLPVTVSPSLGLAGGVPSFWDFQQANGTRQIFYNFGNSMGFLTADGTINNPVETLGIDAGPWSMVMANNILFGANGQRMMKWTGTNWQNWGIAKPTVVPSIGSPDVIAAAPTGLVRSANVVTVTLASTPFAFASVVVGTLVTISGAADPSFNGTFSMTAGGTLTFMYNQTGPNATSGGGTATIQTFGGNAYTIGSGAGSITRASGVVTATVINDPRPAFAVGDLINVSGVTDTSFNGNGFAITALTATTVTWNQLNAVDASSANGNVFSPLSPATGYQWRFAFRNSVTGHIGPPSDPTPVSQTGNNLMFPIFMALQAGIDPQVDSLVAYRTLDGGGDYFFHSILSATSGFLRDVKADSSLDQTQRPQFINQPPLVGKFVAQGQGRIFVANLPNTPQDIIYSGYEQIFTGRPEESFPPQNRLRLSIGAEVCNGLGVLQAGIVAFSQTGKMFMLRGAVEDITVSAPVQFTAFLEELPWALGCLSHFSIQATPYGLFWLAGDKTVQLFDGRGEPQDISDSVYPILRTITPGSEGLCRSAYFNWLERDWYVLLAPVQGSLTLNRAFFFGLQKDARDIDVFITDIQADFIGVATSSQLQRRLLIVQQGFIKNLPVSQDVTGGVTDDLTIIPATAGQLGAFWRSAYFGNDSPQRSKMWRGAKIIADQAGFRANFRVTDDKTRTVKTPEILGPFNLKDNSEYIGINRRGNRVSVEILFPATDAPSNVLEMMVSGIGTADRR